jgi:EAL domain-containing protein (putative c-di-GMP-specific phosphodiesterase class I)
MARRTGARTIMSGIESVHDLDVARDLGIGLVQGPYLAG